MAVTLTLDTTGTAELDGTYTVTWTVTAATDMPEEIFVHIYSSRKYDHVAVAGDLIYPTAPDSTIAFYRASVAVGNYPDITTADLAKTNVETAVAALVAEYVNGLAGFLGTVVTNYP
jgi:hypothetical protein